jgi:hypothetical protein
MMKAEAMDARTFSKSMLSVPPPPLHQFVTYRTDPIVAETSITGEMQRIFATGSRRAYSVSSRVFAAEAAQVTGGTNLVLNFCTPHATIVSNKIVDKVILPGEGGEYGITVGHSPIISELKPGVVTVVYTEVF